MATRDVQIANKMFLAARDIGEAGDYLWSLKALSKCTGHMSEYRLRKALDGILIASAIIYARPFRRSFTAENAAQSISLEEIKLFDGHEDLLALHNKILTIRDKAIAHADWEYHSTSLKDSDDLLGFDREFKKVEYTDLISPEEFERLISHTWKIISDKAYEHDSQLARKLGFGRIRTDRLHG